VLSHRQLNLLVCSISLRLIRRLWLFGRFRLLCWLRLLSRFGLLSGLLWCCSWLLWNSGRLRPYSLSGAFSSLLNKSKLLWVLSDMLEETRL